MSRIWAVDWQAGKSGGNVRSPLLSPCPMSRDAAEIHPAELLDAPDPAYSRALEKGRIQ